MLKFKKLRKERSVKKSLRSCIAVLVACLMILEIPLFAFADTVPEEAADSQQTEEQVNDGQKENDQSDQTENDQSNISTDESTKEDSYTQQTQDAQASADSNGGSTSQTDFDLSKLIEQLNKSQSVTDADANSPRPLPVPDSLKDGNYFFIGSNTWSISEKSTQKLYIPIQRTGDLSKEASVTLKLIDMTSHKGVNYKAEILNENVEGKAEYGDVSMVDLIKDNSDTTEETSALTEEDVNTLIKENGGEIDILDENKNLVGRLTDESSGADAADDEAEPQQTEESVPQSENTDQTENAVDEQEGGQAAAENADEIAASEISEVQTAEKMQLTGTGNPLKDARNQYTGVVSDRQEMTGGSTSDDQNDLADNSQSQKSASETVIEEQFAGTEYQLDFDAGEEAKYLVITPVYSEKAEGDSILELLLKDPTEGLYYVEENTSISYVTITDEDKLEAAYISISDTELYVTGDKALVTLTRTGAVNKMLSVMMTTSDGTAKSGDDYSGVGAKVVFPMGISKRTIEIPVGHSDEAKDFTVKISQPDSCTIVNDKILVTISSLSNTDDAELENSKDAIDSTLVSDSYIGTSYDLSKGITEGNAWYNSDTGNLVASGVGQDEDEWNGMRVEVESGYLYDGARITSSLESKKPSYGEEAISGAGYTIKNDTDRFNKWTIDYLFNSTSAPDYIRAQTMTTSWYGRTLRIQDVAPIKRDFTFNLESAAAPGTEYKDTDGNTYYGLSFEGAASSEMEQYQSVIINADLTASSYTVKSNDNFSINAIGTEYARFVGIDAVREDGTTYRIADVNANSRTATIVADGSTINYLAKNNFINWTGKDKTVGQNTEYDGDSAEKKVKSYSGSITIRPVFEYIDAAVQVNSTSNGYFKINGEEYSNSQEIDVHYGDKLKISTVVTAPNTTALGIDYKQSASKGSAFTKSASEDYLSSDMSYTYIVGQRYNIIEPTFNEFGNSVKVRISKENRQYIDTTRGTLANITPVEEDGYYVYTVYSDVKANRIINLAALTKKSEHVVLWEDTRSDDIYSGTSFYFIADPDAKRNVITLSVNTESNENAYYTLSGTLVTPVMNLSTGNYLENTSMYASKAVVAVEQQAVMSDEQGAFSLAPFYGKGGTKVRYAVSYNGGTELKEAVLPSSDVKASIVSYTKPDGTSALVPAIHVAAGYINISEYSLTGAHVTSVAIKQAGIYMTTANILEMNGKKTVLEALVHDGDQYELNGKTYTENVVGVRFLFIDPKTGTINGECNAVKSEEQDENLAEGTSLWTFTIEQFSLDNEDADYRYNYGDVLYVYLLSDKKLAEIDESDKSTSLVVMKYKPVSTGYSVISDNDYMPQSFEMDPPIGAENMLGSDESSLSDSTRTTYGQFPFIGEIQFIAKVTGMLSRAVSKRAKQDLEQALTDFAERNNSFDSDDSFDSIGELGELSDDAELQNIITDDFGKNVQITVLMITKQLPYGGTRLMIGIRMATGSTNWNKMANPYHTAGTILERIGGAMAQSALEDKIGEKATDLIAESVEDKYGKNLKSMMQFGGVYAEAAMQFGMYIDFGYMVIETTHDDGSVEYKSSLTESTVLLGGGGFIGGALTIGGYQQTFIGAVPVYWGFTTGLNSTIFLGKNADPNLTLKNYQAGDKIGADMTFNVEWLTTVSASGYIGLGVIGVVGIRGTISPAIQIGYGNNVTKWFPAAGSNFGLMTTFTVSGSIDFIGASIPLASYTAALPLAYGNGPFFKEITIGNRVIRLINESIEEIKADGEEEKYAVAIEGCKSRIEILKNLIDSYAATADEIKAATDDLRSYSYENDVLSLWDYPKSWAYTISGLAALMDEDDENAEGFIIPERTASEWVADENVSLEGAYGKIKETELVKNAYSQPSTKLINLGENKMLMVFLDTDTTRDAAQQAVLKYSIYDTEKCTFTWPTVIQDDKTGDANPDLCDAGDSIMISWASADPEKYSKLTEDELKNPISYASCYEIYTVLMDKKTQQLGEIEQLTDDEYCDTVPQGIYDSTTHDRIVMYLKKAPDTDAEFESYTDELVDYIDFYSDQVYTVVAYMLYDASKDTWARDYYYDSEMDKDEFKTDEEEAEYIAAWKGQRFLPSVLGTDEEGGQTDPNITDLTVCSGYNGIGAYAYTVDMDFDKTTTDDKELYIQFYNFADHKTYKPVRLTNDAVCQSMPRFVRNDNNTYLFWLQGTDTLRYVNISELLNLEYTITEEDAEEWNSKHKNAEDQIEAGTYYIVQPDGTFADDYKIEANIVDTRSYVNDGTLRNIGSYQVFTDNNNDLYVVWTAVEDRDFSDPDVDNYTAPAQEIYATALVKESDLTNVMAPENEEKDDVSSSEALSKSYARWSKPYRLTTSGKANDGVAAALDSDGNLILAYNQYTLDYNYNRDNVIKEKINENGESEYVVTGDLYDMSPISLMAARLEPVGSLEVNQYLFSDETPVSGETIKVGVVFENTGLTAVRGADIEFYTYKDGKRGQKLADYSVEKTILVNKTATCTFSMTVPEDFEGMQILCIIKEKNVSLEGGYYPEQEFLSDKFEKKADLSINVVSAKQNGDKFDITYTVANEGNDYAEEGVTAQLHISALYGDAKTKYGVDDTMLSTRDVSDVAPDETKEYTDTVEVPASVFMFCGYDQIEGYIMHTDNDTVLDASSINSEDCVYLMQDTPYNLKINDGEPVTLKKGETKDLKVSYDGAFFTSSGANAVFTVEDTSIATVEDGKLTALKAGTTKITAVLMPYGLTTTTELTVTESGSSSGGGGGGSSSTTTPSTDTKKDETAGYADCKHDASCPISKYTDSDANAWYHDAVHYILESNVMNGISSDKFAPNSETTRAMVATILHRIDGETAASTASSFKDIVSGSYYEKAVDWAAENGVVKGYDDETFGPGDAVTREQMVTMLYRYAQYKKLDTAAAEKSDISAYKDAESISSYAQTAVKWAYGTGIIKGRSDTQLAPKANITRAEIAQMIKNYLSMTTKTEDTTKATSTTKAA